VEAGVVREIRVQPRGCAYTIACASAVSALARGRTLDEVLGIEPGQVAAELGGLPEDHLHCARLAVNVLGEAIAESVRAAREARKDKSHAHL